MRSYSTLPPFCLGLKLSVRDRPVAGGALFLG